MCLDGGETMTAKRTLTLHPYQVEMIRQLDDARDTLLASPTGSGKTTIAAVAARLSFAKGTTHAIIAAPQKQIEEGFVECNGLEVRWPEGSKRKRPVVIPDGFIRSLKPGDRMGRKILEYLANPAPGYALACSHAALIAMLRLIEEHALPENLATATLIVDEAHHAPADELSNVVAIWQTRGGRLRFYTATPERADGRVVATPGMVRIVRSLAEHMLEGFAPAEIVNELVPFRVGGDRVSAAEFTGEAVTQDAKRLRKLAKAIVAEWEKDGRPKAIGRVPPMRGGCKPLVELLDQLLAKAGARVVDSTGLGTGRQRAFRAMLASERGRPFAESEFDFVIGSQRVVEGTDWPVCSHIYSVGIPRSLTLLQQLLGRATRRKDDKHPSRDRVKITFFTPTAGGNTLDRLSMEHSRQALLVCVFLADHESGEAMLAPQGHAFDAYEYAQVKLFMAAELAGRESGTATVGELMDAARAAMPEAEEGLIDYVAVRLLANSAEGGKGKGKNGGVGGANIFKERLGLTPEIDATAKDEFARLVETFRGMTLEEYGSLRSLGRQLHSVTGGQTREIATRFKEAIGRPLTEEMIKAWVAEWKERTGGWPTETSGEIPESGGETWSAMNANLRFGCRGLPGGSSLAKLLAAHFDVRNKTNIPDLKAEAILRWVAEWKERTGKWPNSLSGEIPGSGGEKWNVVDLALGAGGRGLPGGSSLAKLIAEHFNVRNATNLPPLSIELITRWISEWRERKGSFPDPAFGVIPGSEGETWGGVNHALRAGRRGLPGGSSLAKFIAEHFDGRHKTILKSLSIMEIKRWISEWRERQDSWPSQMSGEIPGSGGETWGAIDSALRDGGRGLPSGSSLPRFIADHFSVRNATNKPDLTIKMIKKWITEWKERDGEYPKIKSGEIPGSGGETWNAVNQALYSGGRSLPSGSSLPKLIATHFGVRNDSNKPRLSATIIKQWISEWKQREGYWPTTTSGEIPGSGGETWNAVESALRVGGRGLSGGSSLAKFKAEHFPDSRKPPAKDRPAAPRPEPKPKPRRPSNPEANPE
jgi:hypothetical protein